MTQAMVAERTERKAPGAPIKEITKGRVLSDGQVYRKLGFGVKGRVVAQGRVVKFGPFTLALADGQFEGCEYRVYMAPDGVLQAELVENGVGA